MDSMLQARVSGLVQGVGFRFFVVRQARSLGLAGYVRNSADGSVEVLAEGPAEGLNQLLDHLRRGPSGAEVAAVDAAWGEASGQYRNFDIAW